MKTWEDYKDHAKANSAEIMADIEEAETLASFVTSIIQRRNELGISQRELASLAGLPQSSIARLETMKTVPNIETVIKVVKPLGLQLTLTPVRA